MILRAKKIKWFYSIRFLAVLSKYNCGYIYTISLRCALFSNRQPKRIYLTYIFICFGCWCCCFCVFNVTPFYNTYYITVASTLALVPAFTSTSCFTLQVTYCFLAWANCDEQFKPSETAHIVHYQQQIMCSSIAVRLYLCSLKGLDERLGALCLCLSKRIETNVTYVCCILRFMRPTNKQIKSDYRNIPNVILNRKLF